MQTTERKITSFGPILVFIAAMLWATDAPFRYHLTQNLSASFIVLAEHAVNILLILPFIFSGWREIKAMSPKQWLAVLIIGIGASALASVLFTKAFAFVNPSVAIVLQKFQPLIVIGLATSFLKESLGRRFWLWAILALVGGYIISFPDLKPQLYYGETWNPNLVGVLLALGAALLWGLGTVLGRYLLSPVHTNQNIAITYGREQMLRNEEECPRLNFKTLAALRFLIAFLFLFALNLREGVLETIGTLTPKDILFIVIVAITSGFTSLFIYYKGLETTRASIATFAELGFPFLAVIVNVATLGLFLKPLQVIGMFLLILAVWRLTNMNRDELGVSTT